jgi:hypothetical protein
MAWLNPTPLNQFGLIHHWAESACVIFVMSVVSSTISTAMILPHCIIFLAIRTVKIKIWLIMEVSVARLKRPFELSRCPEVEGALGYAYWKLGQSELAIRHCLSSVTQQPKHFGASKAFHVLRREYNGFKEFARQFKSNRRRVKSVAEEFPGQRIKKPRD